MPREPFDWEAEALRVSSRPPRNPPVVARRAFDRPREEPLYAKSAGRRRFRDTPEAARVFGFLIGAGFIGACWGWWG